MEDSTDPQSGPLEQGFAGNQKKPDSSQSTWTEYALITHIHLPDTTADHPPLPACVYIAIDVDGIITKTLTKSVLIGVKNVFEWGPKIVLPLERSFSISFGVYGSFEVGPQVLGDDKLLCECKTTIGELLDRDGKLQLSGNNGDAPPFSFLSATLERRACDINHSLSSKLVSQQKPMVSTLNSSHRVSQKLSSLFHMFKHSDSASFNPKAALGIFAFIVTIDRYKNHEKHKDLVGCQRDGQRFKNWLTGMLGVPLSQIMILEDENATRDAILGQFRSHLIENPSIAKGDAMIFFYAGHGTQELAPPGWISEGNKMESICPYDANTTGHDGREIYAIHDRTISGLIRQLDSEKGDNIIFILDCCHSGGATRSADMSSLRARFTEPSSHPPPMELDQEIWSFAAGTSSYSGTRSIKGSYRALESHILLAACRPGEIALGDMSGGLFTSALLKALKNCTLHDTTYSRLFERLRIREGSQHPLCLGGNRDRLLFSVTTVRQGQTTHRVFRRGRELYVSAGRIHGVIVGTRFEVKFNEQTITLRAVGVDAFESLLERRSLSIDFAGTPQSASVENWNYPILRVRSADHQSCRHFTVVPDQEEADIVVRQYGPMCEFERFDPLTLKYSTPRITVQLETRQLQEAPIAIANFYSYLYRSDKAGGSFGEDIKVRLNRAQGNGNNVYPVGEDLLDVRSQWFDEMEFKEAIITDFDAKYCLTIENYSDFGLFPYLFYFDPSDYSVQGWYMPPGPNMLPPLRYRKEDGTPSVFAYGYGGFGTEPATFYLPEGQASDSGFLKIFLTNAYAELKTVVQSAIDDKMRVGVPKMQTPKGIWECRTFVLTCKTSC